MKEIKSPRTRLCTAQSGDINYIKEMEHLPKTECLSPAHVCARACARACVCVVCTVYAQIHTLC